MASKTVCPITRDTFRTQAPMLPIALAGHTFIATPRDFESGSVGYYVNGKVSVMVDGVAVMCQVGINVTVIGSKDLPTERSPRAESADVARIRKAAKSKEEADELAALEAATAPSVPAVQLPVAAK